MTNSRYRGGELELFAEAENWKSYYAARLRPYIRGDVLEVGAGIGGTTRILSTNCESSWTCVEPDSHLASQLAATVASLSGPTTYKVLTGTLKDVPRERAFDSILYIDVLEHIEDDAAELREAAMRLRPDGCLVVLAPAHMVLFSPFDRQIGHFRRYNAKSLAAVGPPQSRILDLFYLDSVGIALSLANRLLLRTGSPTREQIAFWDRFIIPVSQRIDRVLRYRIGKTVVAVWQPLD